MDYKTLVTKTAESSGLSRSEAGKALAACRQIILDSLKDGEVVKFVNLGTFRMSKYKATQRRDLNTHEIIAIPERYKPRFSFSKKAEEEVSL